MSTTDRKETDLYRPPSPPQWKGRDSLDLIYQLNERSLQLLRDTATRQREVWSGLDTAAIRRAARFPFVILDACFNDEGWWKSVLQKAPDSLAETPAMSLWPTEVAEKLMRELLVFAWHMARWDWRIAQLSLGMLPGVAEAIAAMTPHQLDVVSTRHHRLMRLRWQDSTDFWLRVTNAARESSDAVLADMHLHGKLLLSGELLTSSPLDTSP